MSAKPVRYCLLLVLAVVVAIMSGCAAPPAPAAPAPDEGISSEESPPTEAAPAANVSPCILVNGSGPQEVSCDPQTSPEFAELQASVCNDIVAFDGSKAFGLNGTDKLLGWTLGINFDDESKIDGRPIGCLRLYLRNEVSETYDAIDNGGIMFDTCSVSPTVTIEDGVAKFCGQPHADDSKAVMCGVDLARWLQSSTMSSFMNANFPESVAAVEEFRDIDPPLHTYENFAVIARTRWAGNCDLVKAELPVAFYEPIASSGIAASSQPSLTLMSNVYNNDTYPSNSISFAAACTDETRPIWYDPDEFHTLWHDVAGASSGLRYVHRRQQLVEVCSVSPPPAFVDFWAGESVLYVGYAPQATHSFMGDIDGILIDPFDSKPPTSFDD